ncbi:unnamed protein product [Larinioides sclopetarius]|uniref:Uncharacterized protein n=1 Tax=Larinioides sclopetarius TaxID=280406 RepID=A0AAV1ZZ91_9ARAC
MDYKDRLTPENLFFTFYEPPEAKYANNKPPIIFIHGILSTPYCWNKVRNKICIKTGRKPEMVEKLVVEDMVLSFDEGQRQAGRKFMSILKMAASNLKQYPPSMSEAVVQKKLQHLFCLSWSKKPTEKINSRPITPILPFHKEASGEFVWDVNIDALTESLENASNFKIRLSDDLVYPGEAIFIGAEYSKFDMINDKQVILKHFPNSKISVAKGVYHSYHMEKPYEYAVDVAEFIGF